MHSFTVKKKKFSDWRKLAKSFEIAKKFEMIKLQRRAFNVFYCHSKEFKKERELAHLLADRFKSMLRLKIFKAWKNYS